MSWHIALQILVKGAIPTAAVSGGIGGLVYHFTSDSESLDPISDLESLFDSPIGDSEYLKSKVKELVDTIAKKKDLFKSIQDELEEAKKSKKSLDDEIQSKEKEIETLDTKKEKLQKEKLAKEQEEKDVQLNKTKETEKNQEIKKRMGVEAGKIRSLKYYQDISETTLKQRAATLVAKEKDKEEKNKLYQTESAYLQTLVDHEWCTSNWFWCWIKPGGVKEEHKGLPVAEITKAKDEQYRKESAAFTQKSTADTEATNALNRKKEEESKLNGLKNNISSLEEKVTKINTELSTSDTAIKAFDSKLTTLQKEIEAKESSISEAINSQENLLQTISSTKVNVEEKQQLIDSKTSELEKEHADLNRLNAVVAIIKAKNPDNTEVISTLPS